MKNFGELILSLEELEVFLTAHGVIGYSEKIKNIRLDLLKGDNLNDDGLIKNTLDELKHDSFGGMGSLTDLVISKKNGHSVNNEEFANKKYWEILMNLQEKLKNIIEQKNL